MSDKVVGMNYITSLNNVQSTIANNTVTIISEDDSKSMYDKTKDTEYGSTVNLQLNQNKLNLIDYGLKAEDEALTGGKIFIRDLELPSIDCIPADDEELQKYFGYFFEFGIVNPANPNVMPLADLMTRVRYTTNETDLSENYKGIYENLIVSPAPLPYSHLYFLRHCQDGVLYFYRHDDTIDQSYVCSPYHQYKCGVNLETAEGVSVMSLAPEYIPIVVNNGLIRVMFDKLGGYIILYRYDYKHKKFATVSYLKIKGNTDLELLRYDDDRVQIKFGKTIWNVWRGRPYVQVEHAEDDIYILDEYDCVWCEVNEQKDNLGVVIEQNTIYGVFNTMYNTNLIDQTFHLFGNMDTRNYNYCLPSHIHVNGDINPYMLPVGDILNRRIEFYKPKNAEYIKIRLGDDNVQNSTNMIPIPDNEYFTFYIQHVELDDPNAKEIDIKATLRGYGFDGRNHIDEGTDFDELTSNSDTVSGEYYRDSNIHTEIINPIYDETTGYLTDGEIRVAFKIPHDYREKYKNIRYIDFQLTFTPKVANDGVKVRLGNTMLYIGDNLDVEYTSQPANKYKDKTKVYFQNNFCSKLYSSNNNYGLGIIRPTVEPHHLDRLDATEMTVLAPYMKDCDKHDRVERLAMEYMFMHNQRITINY